MSPRRGILTWHHLRVLIRGEAALGVILTGVWIYCLLDAIMTEEYRIRNLPKSAWIMLIIFTFEIGAVAWLIAGRPQAAPKGLPYKGNRGGAASRYPEYDRPGRFVATNPDDDEEFLRGVRERARQQTEEGKRQRAERERLEEQAREARRTDGSEAPPSEPDLS
jgi:hypothetical protein